MGGGVKRQHLLHYERSSQRETGYGYYLKDDEPVLHGSFCYRRAGWLFFLPKTSIKGQYADHRKEGVWKFLKRYDGPDRRKVRLTVTFHNGIHEGTYQLTVNTRSGISWVTAQLKDDHATGLLSACIDES